MTNKKAIIKDAQRIADNFAVKIDDLNGFINTIKGNINFIKNYDVDEFLAINENKVDKHIIRDRSAFKMLKDVVKERKAKYTKEELLSFLGYLARELTYFKSKS
ncbi:MULTISPECIES: hypothetical protein [unclassified Petrotoga]|uniref:hypothetical protein n=1 Tax=unclassified Petrotoga TaxID=2620614 RepID=UPI000CB141AC|nr:MULTISPECIES: hypothetical protein [unclassified Petrotoga]MBL5982007.1 hypothetical protein [Petrotoga sp. 8T1HF07.NaAc.6.1]PNR88498.1 hypothetical protein X925_06160 [Petrotoga sp. 9T1HF07.CasAA.8.2]RLL85453.1 hypothetical protein BZ25_04010 [Petrotoga sp. Shatin.DS.tank11.9.2.9.3]